MISDKRKLSYIYITGMEHSGSTLLTFLLNAHPQITSIGEVKVAHNILPLRWKNRQGFCSCGQRYYDCFFWQRVLAGMAARGFGLSGNNFYRPDATTPKEAVYQRMFAFSKSILDVSDSSVFVDASKKVNFVRPLFENPFLDLKILNLYRDGRGVVNSWRKNNPDVPLFRLIRKWIVQERFRSKVLNNISKELVCSIKYENLCLKPAAILDQIYRFIGVDPNIGKIDGFKSNVEHHIVGNPMRLNQDETIYLDEKWRQELSSKDLIIFRLMMGSYQNRINGYLP